MSSPTDQPLRILVVEDDESIAMGLEMNLSAEGYSVAVATDGDDAVSQARAGHFQLLILDVMLPKMNGFEVLRSLRQANIEVPVIMLSARGAEMDKVMGLELGAEDYITKPFGLAELLARVKVVLRRSRRAPTTQDSVVKAGNLRINPDTREVTREGQLVELTATEFEVLLCLVEARGRVLAREQIQAAVWGENHHGTTRTIDNFLLQLRQKLEADPQKPAHLLTVRGVGYRFLVLASCTGAMGIRWAEKAFRRQKFRPLGGKSFAHRWDVGQQVRLWTPNCFARTWPPFTNCPRRRARCGSPSMGSERIRRTYRRCSLGALRC